MSGEEDQDELEDRKDDLWSLDEVRGGGSAATADVSEPSSTEEISDTTETSDIEEQSDINEIEDTTDIDDIEDTQDTGDTSGVESPEDTSVTSDTEVTTDIKDKEDAVQLAEGSTVRQMALDAEAKGLAVRDLHNVNVYLFESVYDEMMSTFKQLDSEYYQKHGEDLSKNKDFFNAVFRAGLQSPELRKELELD